ncbi:hypothetical protein ACGFNP_16635 [Nonomuraea sp. NPDC049269]|uniref:hypothetical protein n=1 Tax=Nonomuraea sp. NPDC049269 TaxID=3364349 RepID=UPI0037141B68
MGFPDERDTSTESTPRRSRRARDTAEPGGTRNPFEPVAASSSRRAKDKDKAPAPTPTEPAAEPVRRSTTWSPYDEGKRSRGPLWFTLGGLAVLGVFVGGLVVMFRSDDSQQAQTEAARRTSAPLPSAPPGKYSYASERKTDPDPLTVKELFATKKVTVAGRSYTMTTTSKIKKCADGAVGGKIQKALKSGKCTQIIRATFRDKAGKVMGTVGVANLTSTKAATKVRSVGSKTDYVKPLAGKDSLTKNLGSGSGGTQIWMYGHYAVMIWFQNKDGSKPDKKGQKKLFQAVDDITKATVFKALDARILTGHSGA